MHDIEKQFRNDLRELLKKYNAEIDVSVEMREYGADVNGIIIYIPEHSLEIKLDKWSDWECI